MSSTDRILNAPEPAGEGRNLTVQHFETILADEWRVIEEDDRLQETVIGVFLTERDARLFAASEKMEAAMIEAVENCETCRNAVAPDRSCCRCQTFIAILADLAAPPSARSEREEQGGGEPIKITQSDCSSCGGKGTLTTTYYATGIGYYCDACGYADGEPYSYPEGVDSEEAIRTREDADTKAFHAAYGYDDLYAEDY